MGTLRQARRQRMLLLRSRTVAVNVFRIFWVLVVLWCELGVFFLSIASCRWPDQVLVKNRKGPQPLHVLIIADAQVPRPYKGWLPSITWLKQYVVNLNLRKSWNAAKSLNPDAVVFLGDMLRHGSTIKDMADYGDYYAQFRSTFGLNRAIPTYYVPGNRDVGLGSSRTFSARARDRFEAYFGPVNQLADVGNHTFVLLDAPALVEEDYRRHGAQAKFSDWLGVNGGSIDFVKSVAAPMSAEPHDRPTILFTHIPLSRPDAASCGPFREHGNIRRGVGRGYQNLLGRDTSKFVLESTYPSAIFSGDDHDYCEVSHLLPDVEYSVREVTVRSFSMATRIKRPGFQLLSLLAPEETQVETTHANSPCLLPNQSRIYTHGYALMILITAVLLFFFNVRRPRPSPLNGNHAWHDPAALRAHDSESDTSPGNPSPPASPIHFKSSHSRSFGLRSASTLTPNAIPSQPATPLGGTPLLSSTFRSVEDDDGQELLLWADQASTPKHSPFPPQEDLLGVDSSSFLPSPGVRKVGMHKKSTWLPSFAERPRLTVRPSYVSALIIPILLVGRIFWLGGQRRPRTWFGRFVQDAVQVAWPPVFVYVGLSLWLFR